MNLLKAQDTKLKVESLDEAYKPFIADMFRGSTKKLVLKSKLLMKSDLLKLIEIAGEQGFYVEPDYQKADTFNFIIY